MNERIKQLAEQSGCKVMDDGEWYIPSATGVEKIVYTKGVGLEKFAELIIEECAREVEEFARKWWSIHCHSNKHAETTRKAHDDFCALQRAIRRRKTE